MRLTVLVSMALSKIAPQAFVDFEVRPQSAAGPKSIQGKPGWNALAS
jgi:hypothetical protein